MTFINVLNDEVEAYEKQGWKVVHVDFEGSMSLEAMGYVSVLMEREDDEH